MSPCKPNECHREKEIAVMATEYKHMAEKLDEVMDKTDKLSGQIGDLSHVVVDLKDFIRVQLQEHRDHSDATYATKEEHAKNAKKIEEIEQEGKINMRVVVGALAFLLVSAFGYIVINLDKLVK